MDGVQNNIQYGVNYSDHSRWAAEQTHWERQQPVRPKDVTLLGDRPPLDWVAQLFETKRAAAAVPVKMAEADHSPIRFAQLKEVDADGSEEANAVVKARAIVSQFTSNQVSADAERLAMVGA